MAELVDANTGVRRVLSEFHNPPSCGFESRPDYSPFQHRFIGWCADDWMDVHPPVSGNRRVFGGRTDITDDGLERQVMQGCLGHALGGCLRLMTARKDGQNVGWCMGLRYRVISVGNQDGCITCKKP